MTSPLAAQEILRRLTGFATVSSRSNLRLIEFVADYLERFGFDIVFTYNAEKTKANVFASKGPRGAAGLILSGHTDVVPVSEKDWETNPFELTEKNGRFYGRGTCDMKGFLAAALAVATEANFHPERAPLHLAFSYDEEVGCLGVPALIEQLNPDYKKPFRVIVGEPTSLCPVNSHKSITITETTVRGHAAHSSRPGLGANAITHAAKLITALAGKASEWQTKGPLASLRTLNPGTIHGGLAPNIVPDHCQFQWDLRQHGEDSFSDAWEELSPLFSAEPEAGSMQCQTTHQQLVSVAGLAPENNQDLASLILKITGHRHCQAVNYLTEAGLFQKAGMEAIVWGPGDIAQAHQTNEYLETSQFIQCQKHLRKILESL